MSRTDKLVSKFLRELNSEDVQDTFSSLGVLLEHLETKNDPEPVDMQIVDTAYQLLEKLKFLEGTLKNYIRESDSILKGSKLQKLYNKAPKNTGSQVMFE